MILGPGDDTLGCLALWLVSGQRVFIGLGTFLTEKIKTKTERALFIKNCCILCRRTTNSARDLGVKGFETNPSLAIVFNHKEMIFAPPHHTVLYLTKISFAMYVWMDASQSQKF